MPAIHKNRAASTLLSAITNAQTTLTVAAGTGARFPAPAAGEYFGVVIQNGDNDADAREYCYCTGRAGDVLTIARGQEGSAGTAFGAGATVAAIVLAGELDYFVNKDGDKLLGALEELGLIAIASAATMNIGAVNANNLYVTGSLDVSSLGPGTTGQRRRLLAANGFKLVAGGTITLPGGVDTILLAGDWIEFHSNGAGWICMGSGFSPNEGVASNNNRNATTSWIRGAMANIATAAGFAISFAAGIGYIKFPSWLGSFIIQFGTTVAVTNASSAVSASYPITFPNSVFMGIVTNGDSGATLSHPAIAASGTGLSAITSVWTTGSGGIGGGVSVRTNWIVFGN